MELPSMVQRSGGRLVVRSLVSGATVYQTGMEGGGASGSGRANAVSTHPLVGAEMLERQLQLLSHQATAPLPLILPVLQPKVMMSSEPDDTFKEPPPLMEPRTEEELPQCKIRRNYSCNACAFFTQNPRSHLSHLRDVHGEKIVINECKLCLYASRHFQKLVRHMKMVHGCSDDDSNGLSGRRHCSREARKRRLEESIEAPVPVATSAAPSMSSINASATPVGPSLKQLKNELQLQEQQLLNNVEALNRQQQLQQMVSRSGNIFSMAFEFQLCMLPPASAISLALPSGRLMDDVEREPQNSSSDSEELTQADGSTTPEALDLSAGSSVSQFQCQKCSYSTPIRARFKKHVKYHSMPLIKCGSCDFHSPYKWNLDRHTKNHGANGYFKCVVCDFSTNIKQSLTIHELNHHVAQRRASQDHHQLQHQHQLEKSGASTLDHAEPPDTEACSSPLETPDSASPISELPPINCSHCHQRMANAMELVSHLQMCEPALRNTTQLACDIDLAAEEDFRSTGSDLSYCGVETAPGYGEVTEQLQLEDSDALKKVFKCPHCSFWAATASRFHVHIVGHLNRKPFECSLCSYRSNWRWDITKHIRLKAMRDKSHIQAQVLMNDETGRRNYAKYNQYLTLMKVSAAQAADAKTMRCGEMQQSSLDHNQPQQQHHHQQAQLLPGPQLEEDTADAEPLGALDLRVSSKPEAAPNEERPPAKQKQSKKQSEESQALSSGKSNKQP